MHFLTISILLYSNLFIQISTSEETSQPFYTKKIDNDNNVWACFREGQANNTDGLNDQSLERLVVYLYKNPVTQEIKAYVPGPDKQALIPNFPASPGNTLKPVTTELISSLYKSQPDPFIVSTKGDPIGLNQGKIKTISFKPVNTESFSGQLPPQNQNVPPGYLPSSTYNEKPQYYPGQQVPQNLYPQFYLQDGYPIYDFKVGLDQTQEINLYDDVEFTTESDAHIKYELPNKTQDKNTETIQLTKAPEPIQAGPPSVKPEVFSPEIANKHLTFDQWFTNQMKTFQDANLPDDVKAIDSDLLRSLVQKTLFENQLNIGSTGLITDADGIPINVQNLELRPILIGNSFNYQSLQDNQQISLPQPLPYLEGILVTLVFPPKILGIIPLGKSYVSKPSPVISQVKEAKVNTPALIKRYNTNFGSLLAKPPNFSSVTVSPFINHWSFASPVTSSPKLYQKASSAMNPFGLSGSLSSSVNVPFLPNLYGSVSSPLFSKRLLRPQFSGAWLRRSNSPKKSEKLKNDSENLIENAKKLVKEATKLEHEAKKLEKEAKKEAKQLEHEAEKVEKVTKKEAKKEVKQLEHEAEKVEKVTKKEAKNLKNVAKKLKIHAEKSKANKDCSTSCSEPKDKPLSGTKPLAEPEPESGLYTPSGPKPPAEPKLLAGPKPPAKSKRPVKPEPPSGPKPSSSPEPESGPHPPLGPKPLAGPKLPSALKPKSGPHSPLGPKPKLGPHLTPRPKPKLGPQPPLGPKSELEPHPPSSPKPPPEPKSPLSPKPDPVHHLPSGIKPKSGPPSDHKSESGPHLPLGPTPNLEPKPQSKPKTEPEKSYRRLGSQDLPPYNLDWARYLNYKKNISSQGFGFLPNARLKDIYAKSSLDSNTPAKPKSGSNSMKEKNYDASVYRRVDYPDSHHKFDRNAYEYLTAIPYNSEWNFPSKPYNNHPQLVEAPINGKWNPQDPDTPQLSIRPLDNDPNDAKYLYTQDGSSPHLIPTPFYNKWNSEYNIKNNSPKWGDHQNDDSTSTLDTNLIATSFNSKWTSDYKINNNSPKWADHQNDGSTSTQDSIFPHLIATPFNSKWNPDYKINNHSPKWADHQNDVSTSTQDSNFPHLIATPLNSKWNSDSEINNKSPKWSEHQNGGSTSTHDSNFPHLIATPFDSKWNSDSKIHNKTPKWRDPRTEGSTSTQDGSSPHLIATPFNSKWNSDSKIYNKTPKWRDPQNDGSTNTKDGSSPHLIATPFDSKWNSDSKIYNKTPKWRNPHNDGSTFTQDNSYPYLITTPFYSERNSDSKSHNKSPKWGENENYDKYKSYHTQYTDAPKMDSYNIVPEKNTHFPKSINPDVTLRSGLGSPNWYPSTTPRPNTRRPKSPFNNARRTYDQISAEIGTEESIEDFQDGNFEKLQHEVEETPSRRYDLPVRSVLKSIFNMVLEKFMKEISGGGDNRRKADEPIDVNATASNPIQIEGAEDDHRDFRIIGGSAATGSGSPLSNKGRSGLNFSFK